MTNSLLALYTKLKGGKCLIYIGREGSGQSILVVFNQLIFELTAPSQLNKLLLRQRPWQYQREPDLS